MSKITEAQKRSMLKYQRSLGQFCIKMKKTDLERYKAAAKTAGMTFRGWVIEAMNKAIIDTD